MVVKNPQAVSIQSEKEDGTEESAGGPASWAGVGVFTGLLGAVNAAAGFAMTNFDTGLIPAILLAIVMVVVSLALMATIVGFIIWLFVASVAMSALFGVDPSDVNVGSFYLSALFGAVIWGVVGAALGYGIAWLVGLVRGTNTNLKGTT